MMVRRRQEESRGGEGVGMDMWGDVCVVKGPSQKKVKRMMMSTYMKLLNSRTLRRNVALTILPV